MDNETIRRVNTGHAERIAALEQKLADMTADYHRWHQAFLDAKYPDLLPTRVDLEAALRWAVQWVPNPTECSPVPPTEIVKIIHNMVIGLDSQPDASADGKQ